MSREHPPPPPPPAVVTTRPSSPPPKPPGRKTPAPPPPSHENEEKENNEDSDVIRDHSDLEQSEHSVKITIEDTPEDSDEDDVDDEQPNQVDKQEDPLEAGYQRSMKRLLSNIAEIPDDECDEAEIVMDFPESEGGSETDDRQGRYKVSTEERQDEEAETEAENNVPFIDAAFTLNETELSDETSEPERFTPEEHCHMKLRFIAI